MARLIDADALIESLGLKGCLKYGDLTIEQRNIIYDTMMMYEIVYMINDAPTVEPKKGKWIESVFASGEKGEICSECRTEKPFNDYGYYDTNYCPNCGARMEDD